MTLNIVTPLARISAITRSKIDRPRMLIAGDHLQ